ncbi:MAG: TonB-dependent receptor [Planctomycetes bacterium]|nr:TonB-dependent receptor [Planctomycetota bacterium]
MPRSRSCSPALLALLLCAQAAGQEQAGSSGGVLSHLSIEELMAIPIQTVFGASKEEQSTLEAPASVTVVEAPMIDAHEYRTLADLLRGVRGVYITNDRNYERLGLRGFSPPGDYNSRALLLVDGHRVNDDVYGTASIGLDFPLDIDLVQRVDLIRGPGSSLYGSNAFLGVIDVRTRRGADVGGWELAGEGGSRGTLRSRATYGRALDDGGDLLLSGTAFSSSGGRLQYDEFAGTPSGGVTEDTDDERGFSLFSQLVHGPWRLQGAYVSREKGIPTGSYGTVFDNPDNQTLDERGWLALSGEHHEDERWELRGRLAYDTYYYRGTYIYDESASGGSPTAKNNDRAWGSWLSGEAELALLSLPRQRLTLGVELRDELRKDQKNYDATTVFLDAEHDGYALGLYAQDEIRLAEGWLLSAGLRADHYDTFGGTTNPRLALIHTPDEESAWKLVYGSAFRPPNAYELYYEDGFSQKANSDLQPETIRTLEGIHERYFAARRWRLAVSAYYNSIQDLIVQGVDPGDGLLVYTNAADATGIGVELELEHRFASGGRAQASWAWQRTEDSATGERLVNSPEHVLQLQLAAPLIEERLELGLELRALAERRTLGGETGAFALLDATLSARELAPGLVCSLRVENLLDREYADPVGLELVQDALAQDGRTLLLRLEWRP